VNAYGQVVISYNKSGFGAGENVSIYAQTFNPVSGGNGAIAATDAPMLVYSSPIDNYHNGSTQSSPPSGRQRWGDYAQVTVDPNNPQAFWIIGEYALGYLPNPSTSFSRWGTFIAEIAAPVPEASTCAMMLFGLASVGALVRRRRV
jgi:hypothetical protein